MRYLIFVGIVLLNSFLTGGIAGASLNGITPDILLCFMMSIALQERTLASMWLGLAGGLLIDLMFAPNIGFYTIPYVIVGAAAFFVVRHFHYIDDYVVPLAVTAVAFFVKDFLTYLMAVILRLPVRYFTVFLQSTVWSWLLTVGLMLLVHWLMRKLYKRRVMKGLQLGEFRGMRGIDRK